jgi:glycosyltransferase involved in cell wall biosynthesis
MNVLVVHSELGVLRGGGENFTRNLFAAFAQRGHNVSAAFLADRAGRYPLTLPAKIKAIPIPGWWSRNPGQQAISCLRRYLPPGERYQRAWDRLQQGASWRAISWHDRRFQRRVERDFAQLWGEFDAVYVHASTNLANTIAKYRPTILRLPGPVAAEAAPALRVIDAVCANGDALKCIRGLLGDQAIELPIGIDTDCFRPDPSSVKSELGWTHSEQVVGYVGRLTHLKGVDLLAAAFHEISSIVPNAKLLIVGNGAEAGYIGSVLAKEVSQGRVHIERDVEHERLPYWYRAMDVLVMPSRYENFSNAMLEAMSCGVPFVASDIGGNRILAAANAGWLFEPGSLSSLIACIRNALSDTSELRARGASACHYTRKCCSWNVSAEHLETIIASLRRRTDSQHQPSSVLRACHS